MPVPIGILRYTHETPHFRIHYAYGSDAAARTDRHYDPSVPTSARHGVKNFAYIENFATYFEAAWRHYFEGAVRYMVPPGVDASHPYRVYVYDIGDVYGVTLVDEILPDDTAITYIEVRNNYRGFGRNDDPNREQGSMKVTAAHEFFHAIQFGYPLGRKSKWDWWMEASATFMEDEVFDAVNDYLNYLGDWFQRPELPLETANGGHEYGSMVFCKHLSEELGGPATIRAVLRRARRTSAVAAIDSALRNSKLRRRLASSSRPDAFSTGFVVSNLLREHPELGYEEGRRYPDLRVAETFSSYPVSTRRVSLDPLAATYIGFRPPAQARTLHLAVGVESGRRDRWARVGAVIRSADTSIRWENIALRSSQAGVFGGLEIQNFGRAGQVREVTVIIANTTWGARARDVAVSYAAGLG